MFGSMVKTCLKSRIGFGRANRPSDFGFTLPFWTLFFFPWFAVGADHVSSMQPTCLAFLCFIFFVIPSLRATVGVAAGFDLETEIMFMFQEACGMRVFCSSACN